MGREGVVTEAYSELWVLIGEDMKILQGLFALAWWDDLVCGCLDPMSYIAGGAL